VTTTEKPTKPRRSARKKKSAKKSAKKKATKKKATKKKAKTKVEGGTLDERREKIRARYEKPVVIYEDDIEAPRAVTRFVKANRFLGGGLKKGAIIEIYGWEDSGKTTTALALAADIQAQAPEGKNHVVMVNYEMPQDYAWWRKTGLLTDKKHFTQLRPKTLEEGMADMADLVQSEEVCCVIIDSVYAASAKGSAKVMEHWRDKKNKGGTGGGIGVEARQWGAAWTATKGMFVEHDVICLAVNQLREQIDMSGGGPKGYTGPKTTTPRGHALKFYAWVRLELKGTALVTDENKLRTDVDGRRVRIRVIKNKTSGDQRGICYYDLIRDVGFDMTSELIALALEAGAIDHKGGGHYVCGKHKIRGRDALRKWVEESVRVREVLTKYVGLWLDKQDFGDDDFDLDMEEEETDEG